MENPPHGPPHIHASHPLERTLTMIRTLKTWLQRRNGEPLPERAEPSAAYH